MRLLHYLEIENFKRFGNRQRIELEHPAVLIGPNNCGKTSAIQALALWSQAVRTWFDVRKATSATERPATALNRLSIVAVPVQRTRFFWHNTEVRTGNKDISMTITVGIEFHGQIVPLSMRFRNQGNDLVYCSPDEKAAADTALLKFASDIRVELLYPMSGLETEEPILQPGRIDVLLGQGQTAQVLRNLCLMVEKSAPEDWQRIVKLMQRLFNVTLDQPRETSRGAIDLRYKQPGVREALDVSSSGRGFQQMLLIFAYLYSHKGSVLLVDEPDAHLEILRQKQVYVLLRDIASENHSQVVMVTHSEVILDEALDINLTLLLDGRADDLARKPAIRNSLKHFGADHYIKARERGYVLYVEGGTDVDMLRAFAERMEHPVAAVWDERINSFYVQNNFPGRSQDSELERVEGGFGITPREHFKGLQEMLPSLKGLAILDNDGRSRASSVEGRLTLAYWRRYEAENYFVTPDVLRRYALSCYAGLPLFDSHEPDIDEVLDALVLETVFEGQVADFQLWADSSEAARRLIWDAKTQSTKLSALAEEFFRRLAQKIGGGMLLTKGELHRLVELVDPATLVPEVREKLDLLHALFQAAGPLSQPDLQTF
ncbi:ATP-binding protein [Sphaerotilus montanus]|jgi:ABC-type branched-subunit amino acid transport system ATPase component|uniref:ABC-type branched-subunit amino acid transport system ATPase component n=1 Tax=Sphaerotilus montanus TaxID=522889 RepID=A0A7Y9U671_9BURK|nr:ATP-binding protein [Sphaerotilus montanus]NYG33733.1 ABC-type branched-subunit amino acid transport system ATPase component [Sphaerotilus montanus]NZD57521.1 ATP-binding protein [Sphaerotilus montanus]